MYYGHRPDIVGIVAYTWNRLRLHIINDLHGDSLFLCCVGVFVG